MEIARNDDVDSLSRGTLILKACGSRIWRLTHNFFVNSHNSESVVVALNGFRVSLCQQGGLYMTFQDIGVIDMLHGSSPFSAQELFLTRDDTVSSIC